MMEGDVTTRANNNNTHNINIMHDDLPILPQNTGPPSYPHTGCGSLWDKMAGEILYKVFTLLGASESYNCSLVCRLWRDLQNDPVLWKSFYFDTFFKVDIIKHCST